MTQPEREEDETMIGAVLEELGTETLGTEVVQIDPTRPPAAPGAPGAADPIGGGAPVPGELSTANGDAARYVVGGKAVFTCERTTTGNRYTYQVTKKIFPDKPDRPFYLVGLLAGPDNTGDFAYVGTLDPSALTLKLTGKSRFRDTSAPVAVLRAILRYVAQRRTLPETIKLYHEGSCCVCGRRLTVPESIRSGIGPVCAAGSGY